MGSERAAGDALDGRVVLVTGAARGIGAAMVEALAAAGARAIACDVRGEVRDAVRATAATTFVADAGSPADMARVVGAVVDAHGRLDAVVANAGAAEVGSAAMDVAAAADMFDRMLHGNLRSAYVTVRAALPALLDGRGGEPGVDGEAALRDVVLVSTDHVAPRPGGPQKTGWMEGYDAAKWGLVGLQRNWAATLGRRGVRVNSLAMGETDTPMLREFLADRDVPAERIEEMATGWLTPTWVAERLVELLADPDPGRTDTIVGLWPGHPPAVRRAATV